MDCCKKNENNKLKKDFSCPLCGNTGVVIKLITPQMSLKEISKDRIKTDSIYKFCKNSNCQIAYFTTDSSHYFTITELKEKATLKDLDLSVKVCYCFNITRQNILSELQTTGKTELLEEVKSKMKEPGCFCEKSNPQGECCLSNISSWIKNAKELALTKTLNDNQE